MRRPTAPVADCRLCTPGSASTPRRSDLPPPVAITLPCAFPSLLPPPRSWPASLSAEPGLCGPQINPSTYWPATVGRQACTCAQTYSMHHACRCNPFPPCKFCSPLAPPLELCTRVPIALSCNFCFRLGRLPAAAPLPAHLTLPCDLLLYLFLGPAGRMSAVPHTPLPWLRRLWCPAFVGRRAPAWAPHPALYPPSHCCQ
jgi:hypothetical protein